MLEAEDREKDVPEEDVLEEDVLEEDAGGGHVGGGQVRRRRGRVEDEEVFKIKPNLIYCSISAYGHDGPKSERPAYDHIVQGMSGIMKLTGTPDTEPNKVGAPYIDYATGMNAAFAIVSALHELKRTQKGIVLDVAMLDTSLLLMASLMTNHLNTGWQP